jgi:hypothetical protein
VKAVLNPGVGRLLRSLGLYAAIGLLLPLPTASTRAAAVMGGSAAIPPHLSLPPFDAWRQTIA